MKPIQKSRKFWITVVASVVDIIAVFVGHYAGLPPEALAVLVTSLTGIAMAALGAFGLEDHGKARQVFVESEIVKAMSMRPPPPPVISDIPVYTGDSND